MLYYDIRALESGAQSVDGMLDASDPIWEEGDVLPAESVHVTGRLSAAGPGRFYFAGELSGASLVSCRRCLEDVLVDVSDQMTALFAESDLDEADDVDVFTLAANARTVDLRPAVRESWVLAVPAFVTCRPDCQGLCPECGADRNVVSCDCRTSSTDARWDALRAMRDSSS